MAAIRASFEKELKHRLSQKSSPFVTEENILLKTFKYFDLTNTGSIECNQFIKVIDKLGIPIFNQQDFIDLFQYYDTNQDGKIEYKQFIGLLYGNITATTRQHSPQKSLNKAVTAQFRGQTPQDCVLKLQRKLYEKGANGILGLARKFKECDKDETRRLDLNEFKKAIIEFSVKLTEEELNEIFNYFDKSQIGIISYDEFFASLRGPLNSQRRFKTQQAFSKLDRDNKGSLHIEFLKSNYFARAHPDVRVNKKTEMEVLSDFLKSIENYCIYTAHKGQYLSIQEFQDLFSFISAPIDNDALYDLLLNNVWQLEIQQYSRNQVPNRPQSAFESPGQQKKPQMSTPGSQFEQDFQLQQQQQPPQQQQVQKSVESSPPPNDQYQNENPQLEQRLFQETPYKQQNFPVQQQQQQQPQPQQLQQQIQQQQPPSQSSSQRLGQQQQQLQYLPQVMNTPQPNFNNESQQFDGRNVILQIRDRLKTRGARGYIGLHRQLKIMDDDFDQKITFPELRKALRDYKVSVSDNEIQAIFQLIDNKNTGKLSIESLIIALQGEMNQVRKNVVRQAFQKMDRDQDGIIQINDIKSVYSAKYNPEVRKGLKTESEVLGEFLETFELHHNIKSGMRDQRVSFQEFSDYYSNVSAGIEDDQFFVATIATSFKLYNDNPEYQSLAPPQADFRQQKQPEFRSKVTINAPFGTSNIPVDYTTNLRPTFGQAQTSNYSEFVQVPAGLPSWPGYNWRPQSAVQLQQAQQQDNPQAMLMLFKSKILSRGIRGLLQLNKMFRIVDESNTGFVSLNEFFKIVKDLRLGFNEQQLKNLFLFFDQTTPQEGKLDYEEFLFKIRGDMNEFRKEMVQKVFAHIDNDKQGFVNQEQIISQFNSRQHPDVKQGKRSEEEVLGEFLDTFELNQALVGCQPELRGKATWEQFFVYYANVSALIEEDKYFDQLMRGVWNIDITKIRQGY